MTAHEHAALIGRHITATAPRRRTLRGVVLPPAPGSRSKSLRITADGHAPKRFDPAGWTITTIAGPDYQYGTLPAQHLATRTMLKTELRLQPLNPDAGQIAEYKVRKGWVPLYAVADAIPLAALPSARAAAWTRVRTCTRCTEVRPRPLHERPGGVRYCSTCQPIVALERWTGQAHTAQSDAAAWAREVLADPQILLIARDSAWGRQRIRIETLRGSSPYALITDVRVRNLEDPDAIRAQHNADWTTEQIQGWNQRYDGTVPPSEFRDTVAAIGDLRIIGWSDRDTWLETQAGLTHIKVADSLGGRVALWSGQAPRLNGTWYPEPRLPWSYYPQNYPPYDAHSALREADDLPAQIENLRTLLHLMAEQPAPEPATGD